MSFARRILLWGSQNRWLEDQMRRRAFSRRATRRFLPGEELSDALDAAERSAQDGLAAILTQLGENVKSPADADSVRDHYVDVLQQIHQRGTRAVISVKPTQLGVDIDVDRCLARMLALVELAEKHDESVWIDMEDSSYVDVTLDLFRGLREHHTNVGVCLQAYLRRTATDLEELLPLNPTIRLVKGAYNEPATIALPRKSDVDTNYRALGAKLIEHAASAGGAPPVFGTHDIPLARDLLERADAAGLAKDACEVHMLYGIRSEQQRKLASEGYGVRILISYGTAWFPWYMRRLAERPANVWFIMRSVVTR
jgi:proline dehydrogenase